MSNNNSTKKANNGSGKKNNGNGKRNNNGNNTQSQKKGKRSAAALERRRAKWETQKAERKASALAKQQAKQETRKAEEEVSKQKVINMFPNVMGIVGAQGYMPEISKASLTTKTMAQVPLFQNAHKATVYPNGLTLLGNYLEKQEWDKALALVSKRLPQKILDYPMREGPPPLAYVFENSNRVDLFKELLEKGANPNIEWVQYGRSYPFLTKVCMDLRPMNEKQPFLDELLKHKVDINKIDSMGFTALDAMIRTDYKDDEAKYLIDHGADVERQNKGGFNAILTAIANSNITILNYILQKHTIDINKATGPEKSLSPLKVAVLHGNQAMLNKVLSLNPDVNQKDQKGNTALHYAIMAKSYDKIQALKNAGANKSISNKEMVTPFDLAKALEREGNPRPYQILTS